MPESFKCAYDELVDLHKLQPNPKNSNIHPPEQIERLSKIIDFQGQRSPIVVSSRSGFVTKGHGRLLAIQKLGWKQAAVDYQEYENEAQEYADMVADNKISEWSDMSIADININLAGLDIDHDLLGIRDFNLQDIETVGLPELSAEEPGFQQVTFVLSNEQKDILDEAMEKAKKNEDCSDEINESKNGNILTAIVKRYVHG